MKKETVKQLKNIDDTIDYWKHELKIIKGRSSVRDKCLVVFGDDFSKVDGYYKRAHIPAEVAYDLVLERLKRYIEELKRERLRIERSGTKKPILEIIRDRIPFLNNYEQ